MAHKTDEEVMYKVEEERSLRAVIREKDRGSGLFTWWEGLPTENYHEEKNRREENERKTYREQWRGKRTRKRLRRMMVDWVVVVYGYSKLKEKVQPREAWHHGRLNLHAQGRELEEETERAVQDNFYLAQRP